MIPQTNFSGVNNEITFMLFASQHSSLKVQDAHTLTSLFITFPLLIQTDDFAQTVGLANFFQLQTQYCDNRTDYITNNTVFMR